MCTYHNFANGANARVMNDVSGIKRLSGNPLRYLTLLFLFVQCRNFEQSIQGSEYVEFERYKSTNQARVDNELQIDSLEVI